MIDIYRQISTEVARTEAQRGQPIKLRVISNSMAPLLRAGDWITARSVEWTLLRRGDVIVFQRETELVTHRLIDLNTMAIVTKGDNRYEVDGPLDATTLIGRVSMIERAGQLIDLQRLRWQWFNRFTGWAGHLQLRLAIQRRYGARAAKLISLPFRAIIRITFFFVSI